MILQLEITLRHPPNPKSFRGAAVWMQSCTPVKATCRDFNIEVPGESPKQRAFQVQGRGVVWVAGDIQRYIRTYRVEGLSLRASLS